MKTFLWIVLPYILSSRHSFWVTSGGTSTTSSGGPASPLGLYEKRVRAWASPLFHFGILGVTPVVTLWDCSCQRAGQRLLASPSTPITSSRASSGHCCRRRHDGRSRAAHLPPAYDTFGAPGHSSIADKAMYPLLEL